jgi:hypothetical protein
MSGTRTEAPAEAGVIEQAQEKVGAGVEQAKSSAGSFIQSQVDQRSTQVGEQLQGAGHALRQAAQTMEQEGSAGTQLVDRAATQVERTARYLSQSGGSRILNDFEGFGRRSPWAVIGGGIVLGLLGARFLKASSSRRFEEYRRTYYNQASSAPRQIPPVGGALHGSGPAA